MTKTKPKLDIETLAVKAREARSQKCMEEVRALLDAHRCELNIIVQVGDQMRHIDTVLGLPTQISIDPK